jgi:hypothetical protein
MIGSGGGKADRLDGIIPQIADEVFRRTSQIQADSNHAMQFLVQISFIEVYEDSAYDLLAPSNNKQNNNNSKNGGGFTRQPLDIRDFSPVGAVQLTVSTTQSILDAIRLGSSRRITRATGIHDVSSRSHAIVIIKITKRWKVANTNTNNSSGSSNDNSISNSSSDSYNVVSQSSTLQLVDLAGSESMERAHGGQAEKSGCDINLGLLVLGRVLEALASKKQSSFVPFRDSVLTKLLQPGIGGNALTWMIATISPDQRDLMESTNTLKFAVRARQVKINPQVAKQMLEDVSKNDPLANDSFDPESDPLMRRCVWISTRLFGPVWARVAGNQKHPLLLFVHGSGPTNSSLQWNFLVPQMLKSTSTSNSKSTSKSILKSQTNSSASSDTVQSTVTDTENSHKNSVANDAMNEDNLKDFYCVAIDCPGYGRSPGNRQTIRSYPGQFLSDIVTSLGKTTAYCLIGSSQGACAVLNTALQCPDLSHFVAVCHPVGHNPQKYVDIEQPTLLAFDTEDVGHPVSVGRLMKRYLPHPHYFEFAESQFHGRWLHLNFARELRKMMNSYPQLPPKNAAGNHSKLPDLTKLSGGIKAWSQAQPNEEKDNECLDDESFDQDLDLEQDIKDIQLDSNSGNGNVKVNVNVKIKKSLPRPIEEEEQVLDNGNAEKEIQVESSSSSSSSSLSSLSSNVSNISSNWASSIDHQGKIMYINTTTGEKTSIRPVGMINQHYVNTSSNISANGSGIGGNGGNGGNSGVGHHHVMHSHSLFSQEEISQQSLDSKSGTSNKDQENFDNDQDEDGPQTEHGRRRLAEKQAEIKQQEIEEQLSQTQCSRCNRFLYQPQQLFPCMHIQCGPCAAIFAKLHKRCFKCQSSVDKIAPVQKELAERLSVKLDSLHANELKEQTNRMTWNEKLIKNGTVLVYDYGNTASPHGPADNRTKRAMNSYLRPVNQASFSALLSVFLDINPGSGISPKPEKKPNSHDGKQYELERSMMRSFPCFFTLALREDLLSLVDRTHVNTKVELQYMTQHEFKQKTRKLVIILLPSADLEHDDRFKTEKTEKTDQEAMMKLKKKSKQQVVEVDVTNQFRDVVLVNMQEWDDLMMIQKKN